MQRSPNRFRFSQRSLTALKPATKPTLFYDLTCPGLGVRLSPKGKQTFFFQDGAKRTSLKTEHLETARKSVRQRQATDAPESEADTWTLGQLFELWMETHSRPKKRTSERDESRFDRYLKPWAKRRLRDISRIDVTKLHNRIHSESGPYAANDTLAFIVSLYNYADRFDYSGRNPGRRIEKYPEQERERYLTPDEFPRWHAAVLQTKVSVARDFFLLALWTGVRREAVLSMRWEHIDLNAKLWRIPQESDKGKRDLIVYLSEEACSVLKHRKSHAETDWVLPSPNGSKSGHYADPKAAWAKILERSEIKDLRIHDLRRTLGSWMAEGGASLPVIGKTLGHKSLQATRIYARLGGNAVRNAVNSATQAMKETLD